MKRCGIWCERDVHFAVKAQEATLLDYLHEVEHMAARIVRLNSAIEEALKVAPAKMRAVIDGLQALREIAQISAVTIQAAS
jgi:transposase